MEDRRLPQHGLAGERVSLILSSVECRADAEAR